MCGGAEASPALSLGGGSQEETVVHGMDLGRCAPKGNGVEILEEANGGASENLPVAIESET